MQCCFLWSSYPGTHVGVAGSAVFNINNKQEISILERKERDTHR